jgi:hypothetical protein
MTETELKLMAAPDPVLARHWVPNTYHFLLAAVPDSQLDSHFYGVFRRRFTLPGNSKREEVEGEHGLCAFLGTG